MHTGVSVVGMPLPLASNDCEVRSRSFSESVPALLRRGGGGKTVMFGGEPLVGEGESDVRTMGIGLEKVVATGEDMFKKFKSLIGGTCSTGVVILRKLRSLGIAVIGSPIITDCLASLRDATEETVTNGVDPGKEVGGVEGALFIRNLSLKDWRIGVRSWGIGGRGPVGGGAGGARE